MYHVESVFHARLHSSIWFRFSVDRFVAVAFPVRHKIFMEKGGLNFMLIASWSLPILPFYPI